MKTPTPTPLTIALEVLGGFIFLALSLALYFFGRLTTTTTTMNKEPIDPTLSAAAAALGRKGGLRRRTHPDRSALARLGGLARAASLRAARAAHPNPANRLTRAPRKLTLQTL
jgi:hypothetical protein